MTTRTRDWGTKGRISTRLKDVGLSVLSFSSSPCSPSNAQILHIYWVTDLRLLLTSVYRLSFITPLFTLLFPWSHSHLPHGRVMSLSREAPLSASSFFGLCAATLRFCLFSSGWRRCPDFSFCCCCAVSTAALRRRVECRREYLRWDEKHGFFVQCWSWTNVYEIETQHRNPNERWRMVAVLLHRKWQMK